MLVALSSATLACSEPQTAAQRNDKALSDAVAELSAATRVVDQAYDVPLSAKGNARCLVVAPAVEQGAFLVGASYGRGVVTCRTASSWSGPAFVKLTGLSVGLQAGGQSTDILMIVTTSSAVQRLFQRGLKLGADASVAAGPVGAGAGAASDTNTSAEILTYTRSKGAFAGVDFSGTSISYDMDAAAALYGPLADVKAILTGAVPAPVEAHAFREEVSLVFPGAPP
jgi:lipid-binding SYLF domain-containing protein